MPEFRKRLDAEEVSRGVLTWDAALDPAIRAVLPASLVFDLVIGGTRYEHLTIDWEKRELNLGDAIQQAHLGSEIVLSPGSEKNPGVKARILNPVERIVVRKRLSHNEYQHRYLKWYARENELYRRLFPQDRSFLIEVAGRRLQGRPPDFEKRNLIVGDALRAFSPGDDLLLRWSADSEIPTLVISKEESQNSIVQEATTSLRAIVTRLISRPLDSFNEGEVKGLIVLLDENKKLWEILAGLRDENQRLKEQINMLESVFEQFRGNSFFQCKRTFEEWVATHIAVFEKGIRVLHRDYDVTIGKGKKQRLDLLCQDRKGILVAVIVLYNPTHKDLEDSLRLLAYLQKHVESLGRELTKGLLKAAAIRGMVVTNVERPELVETCLQRRVKLCVAVSGCVIDVVE